MKRILLSIVAIFIITTSFAQEEVNYFEKKNEINIQIDDIFAKQNLLDFYYLDNYYDDVPIIHYNYPDFSNSPAVGIGYKHHFSKGAIRVKGSLSIFTRTYRPDEDNDDNNVSLASYYERVSAGYEFHQNWGRTQVFFGIDGTLAFQTLVSKQNRNQYNDPYYEGDKVEHKNVSSTISYGVMPFIGFRYYISPKFSISTEYHLLMEGFVSANKLEIDGEKDDNIPKTTGFRTKFGPKGQITFSYHF